MFTGSANVAAGAIDMDDAQAMAEAFGPPEDFDEGSQEVPKIIKDMQSGGKRGGTKGSTSRSKMTPAQKAKADAKKAKEAAAAKAKRDKEKADAKAKRDAEREAARKAKAEAKAAGPDLSGFVDGKAKVTSTLKNIPLELLDGIDGGDPVDRSFVENVRTHGRIFEPIIVRATEDGRFNILAGKRRSQAARALEFATIPAVVESGDLSNDFIIGLTENYARSNNAIEEYRMVKALIDQYREQHGGDTGADDRKAVAAISKATGMTVSQVKKARGLERLVPELVTAVEEGAMASWSAQHASRMPVEVQRQLVDTLNREGKVTVDDINVARRHRQHEAVKGIVDGATETGQDMFNTPDVEDDAGDNAPAPTTRVQKVARGVTLCREALDLFNGLSSKSADEQDAVALLTQIIENLTTSAG
jgi:hypothetical protein